MVQVAVVVKLTKMVQIGIDVGKEKRIVGRWGGDDMVV